MGLISGKNYAIFCRKTVMMFKKIIIAALFLIFTSACALEKTSFYSEPSGAHIFINGKEIGRTPCEYEYRTSAGKTYEVRAQADGYVQMSEKITAEEIDLQSRDKWLVAGIVWSPFWLGSFFTKKLKDTYHFFLKKEKSLDQIVQSKVETSRTSPSYTP